MENEEDFIEIKNDILKMNKFINKILVKCPIPSGKIKEGEEESVRVFIGTLTYNYILTYEKEVNLDLTIKPTYD